MNELTTINISNKAMANHIETISNLLKNANANAWGIARTYSDIVSSECWKDDFHTLDDVAKLFGVNKSTISRYARAYQRANQFNLLTTTTCSTIAETLTLTDEQFETIIDRIDIMTTQKVARMLVKEVKALTKHDEVEDDTELEVEHGDTEVVESKAITIDKPNNDEIIEAINHLETLLNMRSDSVSIEMLLTIRKAYE